MFFRLEGKQEGVRAGILALPHGEVKTPVFMPVGTQGSVKALSPDDLKQAGSEIILANTYHLYLRPGDKDIKKLGGLHEFMRWKRPILTDSGGYQVSSLGLFKKSGERLTKVDEEGVTFASHLDGKKHRMTPEKAIEIQENLGADIIMAFDEATPEAGGKAYAKAATGRTHRWLVRCKARWEELEKGKPATKKQYLFGIIQGGNFKDLRQESAKFVVEQDLPGIAIGGATIGQSPEQTEENIGWIKDLLPPDKPVYAMGVGVNPEDIIAVVEAGADMFDCVAPTKLARMGSLYWGRLTKKRGGFGFESEFAKGRLSIDNARFKNDKKPIMEGCDCYTCREGFSRAYLNHLFKARELLYYRLASIHNVRFVLRLTEGLRAGVLAG